MCASRSSSQASSQPSSRTTPRIRWRRPRSRTCARRRRRSSPRTSRRRSSTRSRSHPTSTSTRSWSGRRSSLAEAASRNSPGRPKRVHSRPSGRLFLTRCKVCVVFAVLASSLIAVPQASALHRADGVLSDWVGTPTSLAGQTRVGAGELIYDDWLYDDYGADLDHNTNQPVFRGNLAPTQGDYRYPTNSQRYGYNAADIREVRLAADNYGL